MRRLLDRAAGEERWSTVQGHLDAPMPVGAGAGTITMLNLRTENAFEETYDCLNECGLEARRSKMEASSQSEAILAAASTRTVQGEPAVSRLD